MIAQFKVKNKGFPFSTKAELFAILTLMAVLGKNTKIKIYTDSNNVISNIQKWEKNISLRRKLKEKNFW